MSAAELHRLEAELEGARTELEGARAELDLERRRLANELAFARRVQVNLMPAVAPAAPGWEVATAYLAAREVGGDFFDLYDLPARPHSLGLVVADVSGKGVTAALMMAFSRAVLRSAAYNGRGPADALRRTNRVLVREARTGLFLTAFVSQLDVASGVLRWASAGHEAPLLFRAGSGRVGRLDAAGELLGMFDRLTIRDRSVALRPGDMLVAYSDGVTEARDPNGRFFGEDRLRALVRAHAGDGAAAAVKAIEGAVEAFAGGAARADDVTIVALSRNADGNRSAAGRPSP